MPFRMLIVTLMSIVILSGCSSGQTGSPINPDMVFNNDLTDAQGSTKKNIPNQILWGYWEITLNPSEGTVEIIPLRGATWTVNVVNFLQPPAGKPSIAVKIVDTSEWLTKGHLPVDVSLTHPFPGMPQFTGADVRGVFITSGSKVLLQDNNLVYADKGINDPYLANADGYTRWMNPTEFATDGKLWTFKPGQLGMGSGFNATLNAYKYFANGLSAQEDLYGFFKQPANLSKRGQFLSGTVNTRRYDLYFPLTGSGGTPKLTYQYAVLASWEPATNLDPGDLPGSFPPDANTREAFLINVIDESTLYWSTDKAGGDVILKVEIFNWQAYLGAAPSIISDLSKVIIESPQGILPDPYVEIDATTLASTAIPGTTSASSIVTIEINGCTPKGLENQEVLITIEQKDKTYDNYGYGTNYANAPLSAYFFHTLNVSDVIPQENKPVITAINPYHGLPNTYLYDVIITGKNLSGVTELKLQSATQSTIALNLQVIDSQHLGCELNLTNLNLGFYDVIGHDPINGDGVLKDGFKVIDCPVGIHQSLTLYSTDVQFDPLFVAGVLTDGPYAGQIITQAGASGWNRINVGDPPSDNTPVVYFASKPSLSSMYTDWSWSLDADPINKIFAFTTFDDDDDSGTWPNTQFDFIKICKQSDGSYVGACDTNCGYAVGQVDVDERGNIWAVCSNAYYPNMSWTIQRWNYDASAPAPHYVKVGEWDVSSIIGGDRVVSDIVVLQRYRRMYVSCSNGWSPWGVRIYAWNINTDPPTYIGTTLLTVTGFYGTDSYQEVHQRFVDMDVDRRDDVLAACRIMVMFMGQPSSSNRTLELRKLDLNLNVIASASHSFYWDVPGIGPGWFSNFVLDDQHNGRVVAIYDRFTLTGPGKIGVCPAPPDW